MKKNKLKSLFVIGAFLISFGSIGQNKVYSEKNGLIVIETENLVLVEEWKKKESISNFSGTGYIQWEGTENFNNTSKGNLEIPIKIKTPGTYEIRIRMAIADLSKGTTEHNDTWLKIIADDFIATKALDTIRPKPICTQLGKPCPVGSSINGFFKMFGGGASWQWHNKTSDFNDRFVHAVFNKPGEYKIIIAARSKSHALDKIVMYNIATQTKAEAEKLSNTETIEEATNNNICKDLSLNAIAQFTTLQVSGFAPAYVDNGNQCLAINAAQHKDKFAAATTIFKDSTAFYNITLNTLTELDGESEYNVYIDDKKVGAFKNPTTTVDYAPASANFLNVEIKKGSIIRVEFSSNTNGKIPEGTTTAYSRGRWRSIDLKCANSSGATNKPPTIKLLYPKNEESFTTNEPINIKANANDSDGNIAKVLFFVNQVKIGETNTPPYSLNWTPTEDGKYEIYSSTIDNKDSTVATNKISITIKKEEQLPVSPAPIIEGELKKWHNIKLTFDGPTTDEDATYNPFLNYKMDVTFVHESGSPTLIVPGYFAGDGNSSNTSAKMGNKWRVHFRPNKIGKWSYKASLKKGINVAIDKAIGTKIGSFDGLSGDIIIQNSDKKGQDLRAKGKLVKSSKNYLQFSETKDYFLKFGPDSPENLLNYNDFDFDDVLDNCDIKCYQHKWTGHANDFKEGNPTWKTNKGKNLIGAINYLADSAKVNSFSMSLFGGDDLNVFAWPKKNEHTRFDISKLDQWETIIDFAEQKGIVAHLKLSEAENFKKQTEDELKLFYREILARFGHHLGLEINIGEEFAGVQGTGFGTIADAAKELAKRGNYLQNLDPYQSPIAAHTGPTNGKQIYEALLQIDPKAIHIASFQDAEANSWEASYLDTKQLHEKCKLKNTSWAIYSDEQNPGGKGVFNTSKMNTSLIDTVNSKTRNVLWGNLMAGGSGVMWYGGSVGDFQTENYRRYKQLDQWSRIAVVDFFQKLKIPFWKMTVNQNLAMPNTNNFAFSHEDSLHIIYSKSIKDIIIGVDVDTNMIYEIKWYNPTATNNAFENPLTSNVNAGKIMKINLIQERTNEDWIIVLRKIIPPVITSNEENNHDIGLKIYPNPSNKGFTIETKSKGVASIINSMGVEIEKTEINERKTIGNNITTGSYFLLFKTKNKQYVKKIIKN